MEIFIEIVNDVIEAFILLSIFQIFMDEKNFFIRNKVKTIVFFISFTAFICWSSINANLVNHTLLNIIFSLLLLIYITNINIYSAIIIYFIFTTLLLITEMSIGIIEMMIFNVDMKQILLNSNYMLIFNITVKSIQILIVMIMFKFNLSIRRFKLINKENSIYHNFIFAIGTFGILTFTMSYGIYEIKNMTNYNIIVFLLYIVFFLMSVRDLKEKDKLIKIKNKYQIQESHIKNMEQIISIIRKEKHDFANHINVIQALCTSNKPNAVERIKEYVSEISCSLHNSFKYLNTGNDYIDGLLSIKNSFAIDSGINFQVNISDPLSNLEIKSKDLISIISNLVDNSFEAFDDNISYDDKEVFFDTTLNENKYIIEIGNNGKEIPPEIKEHIFKKGFSTKGDKNSNHGFGLFIVKELVEKHHGNITVESDEFETIFRIIFDLRKVIA